MIALLLIGVGALALNKKQTPKKDSVNPMDKYDAFFKLYGNKYGVPWIRLKRISWIESKVGTYSSVAKGIANPNDVKGSVSSDGKSWGVMQMTLSTASDYDKLVTPQKLNNPEYSIELSAKFMRDLIKIFPNERDAVMAYNHGQGNQKNFIIKEKAKTLLNSDYPQGRDYWNKYKQAQGVVG